jgi:hypothetical protein
LAYLKLERVKKNKGDITYDVSSMENSINLLTEDEKLKKD